MTSWHSSGPILSPSVSLCSLEKENYEVWAKVVKLNQELEREKKKSEELELRLLDLERSREDMERTNKRLEEEVQKLSKPMSKTDAKSN